VPWLVLLALGVSGAARAGTAWEATYNAQAGYTDNATVTTDTATGATTALPSAFFTLSPGIGFTFENPRVTQRASYVFTANLFADTASGANSSSHQLNYVAGVAISPMSDLLFNLGAGLMQSNTASLDAGVGRGITGAVAGGDARFANITASLGLSHDVSPLWRVVESLGTNVFAPISDDPGSSSFQGTITLGLEREFESNRLFFGALGGTSWIEAPAGGGDDATQYSVGVNTRWTHELARNWQSELGIGGLYATLASDTSQFALLPTGDAALSWRDGDGHQVDLSYTRGATLNPLVAEIFATDDVSLRGALPLFYTRLVLAASVSYLHSETLLPAPGSDPERLDTLSGDLALAYELSPTIAIGLRYQAVRQRGDTPIFPDVDRQTVVVTLSGRYPDEEKQRLSERFSRPSRMERAPVEDARPRRGR
jgi:hypothetical protein